MRLGISGFVLCTSLLVGTGCANRSPNSTAAPPLLPPGGGAPLLTDEQVEAARKLYIAKCASCHKFHSPAKYTEPEWDSWMRKMSRKAKLKSDQEGTLQDYLSLFRR